MRIIALQLTPASWAFRGLVAFWRSAFVRRNRSALAGAAEARYVMRLEPERSAGCSAQETFVIDFAATFIFFFAVIDPIGTVPVYLAVTRQHGGRARRKIALVATLVSAAILLLFIVAGEIILTAMSIPLAAFQIAGGIVLFLFALTMIFGESKPEEEIKLATDGHETAIFPLAVPSIAGPGAMLAAVLLTENARFSLWEQAQTAITMLLVLLVAFLLMLAASSINRIIGESGASVISRVMGLILASVATSNALAGVKEYFSL